MGHEKGAGASAPDLGHRAWGPDGRRLPEAGPGHRPPFGQEFLEKKRRFLNRRLDLAVSQREAFRRLHEEFGPQIRQQAERVRAARLRLRQAAALSGKDDLRGLLADVGRRQARLDSLVTEVMFQELEILDQGQRQKYLGLMPSDRFERRFGRKPWGHGRPPRGQ